MELRDCAEAGLLLADAAGRLLAFAAARSAQQRKSRPRRTLERAWRKVNPTSSNDRVVRQLIERGSFRTTLTADLTANVVRNVWSYAIIFCGHCPDQTYTFSEEETADETRGAYYVRHLLGAANIEGSPLFHVISGNLVRLALPGGKPRPKPGPYQSSSDELKVGDIDLGDRQSQSSCSKPRRSVLYECRRSAAAGLRGAAETVPIEHETSVTS